MHTLRNKEKGKGTKKLNDYILVYSGVARASGVKILIP